MMRWDPLQEIDVLHRTINRLFDEAKYPSTWRGENTPTQVFPLAELSETEDALKLKLELPGMDINDVDIQVTKNSVYITGEKKEKTKTETNGLTRSEFRYGKFERLIPLPALVDNNKTKAEYKNGILTLHLPKPEEAKNEVVKVNIG